MDELLKEIATIKSLIQRNSLHLNEFDAHNHIREEYDKLKNLDDSDDIVFDITVIPTSELKRQYIDYSFIVFAKSFDNPLNNINEDRQDRTSRPLGEVQNAMFDKYHFQDWQFQIHNGRNGIEVCLVIPLIGDNAKMVEEDMVEFCYFCSKRAEQNNEGMTYLAMKYEPSFQDNVSNIVRQYEFLYHATPSENIPSIMEHGLTPQTANSVFTYPPRVHLIKGDVTENGQNLVAQTLFRMSDRTETELEYTILTLNVDLIPNIPFYFDPNHEHGIFTNDRIPSSAIVSSRTIMVRKR